MQTVKVADYRSATDHLFRVVNVDYHACVNAAELRTWQTIARRVLGEVEQMTCKRANDYDQERHRNSLEAARLKLIHTQNQISQKGDRADG